MITATKRVMNWRQIRKCDACQMNIDIGQQKVVVELPGKRTEYYHERCPVKKSSEGGI